MKRNIVFALAATLLAFGLAWHFAWSAEKFGITLTTVPPWDSGGPDKMGTIAGKVTGDCKACKVVLYSHGDVWHVQPYEESSTPIQKDKTWTNRIHLGTEYAALLVLADYEPLSQTDVLPTGSSILASKTEPGRKQ
jgi:hypothetical protein